MKEKKVYKIENKNEKKYPKRNYIKYYVNEEKGTVTAVLEDARTEMADMFDKKFSKFGCIARGDLWRADRKDALAMAMKNVPSKLTATVRCAQEDMENFNVEFGCSLARFRLLQKMYKYRCDVANKLAETTEILTNSLLRYVNFCDDKFNDFTYSIDASINQYFSENNLNL